MKHVLLVVMALAALTSCQLAGRSTPTIESQARTSDTAQTQTSESSSTRPAAPSTGAATSATQAPGCAILALPELGPEVAHGPGRGRPPLPPILESGSAVLTPEEIRARGFDLVVPVAPLPLQVVIAVESAPGTIEEANMYFTSEAIDEATTLTDIVRVGGVLVEQRMSQGNDAALVRSELGDRAAIIQVGPYDAALVWADPFLEGHARSYNVYWSDLSYDWAVTAWVDTPEASVAVARSVYCD